MASNLRGCRQLRIARGGRAPVPLRPGRETRIIAAPAFVDATPGEIMIPPLKAGGSGGDRGVGT